MELPEPKSTEVLSLVGPAPAPAGRPVFLDPEDQVIRPPDVSRLPGSRLRPPLFGGSDRNRGPDPGKRDADAGPDEER